MTHAYHDVRIDRPIADVFEFLADGRNNPQWQHLVISTQRPDGPIGVGSVFRQRARHPLGLTVSADYRVSEYIAPNRLSVHVISGGPFRPTLTFDLVSEGGTRTAVRCTLKFQPGGIARLATPALSLLHPLFAWEAASVERARPILEARSRRVA